MIRIRIGEDTMVDEFVNDLVEERKYECKCLRDYVILRSEPFHFIEFFKNSV